MKTLIKLIWLLILTLFCQSIYSQGVNKELVKSFSLKAEQVPATVNRSNAKESIKTQLGIPGVFEFKIQKINGIQNITEETDNLGYTHERYKQFYQGVKVENSDIRMHYQNGAFVSANGEYIDVPDIDTSVTLSLEQAMGDLPKQWETFPRQWETFPRQWETFPRQ
jgi:Zn-dependent metalloprotease